MTHNVNDKPSETLLEVLAWSYANLARADVALKEGAMTFSQLHHIIRSKLYKGLVTGSMSVGSFFNDEKLKLGERCCVYCGSTEHLSLDHLIPRKRLGSDLSENLVLACRACNSSKGERDMLTWMIGHRRFPSIYLLRRYLKLVYFYCQEKQLLGMTYSEAVKLELPFDLQNLKLNLSPLYHLDMVKLDQCSPLNHDWAMRKGLEK